MRVIPTLCLGTATLLAAATPLMADALSEALGGPVLECSGTIVWAAEVEGGETRDEPMMFAVLDDPGANQIALYDKRESFLLDDVWQCSEGFCTSLRVLPTGVTTNVLRLIKAPDASDGKSAYGLSAVFSVVSGGESGLTSAAASGNGTFACDKPLPVGVIVPG
jgi:hypothetical protein